MGKPQRLRERTIASILFAAVALAPTLAGAEPDCSGAAASYRRDTAQQRREAGQDAVRQRREAGRHSVHGRTRPPAGSAEKACHDLVQGKIAWDYKGTSQWQEPNVERLCRGTSKGTEPANCFRLVMHAGIDWGGGTRWEWRNAVDLCEGTHDAARTIECFGRRIRAGSHWREAIRACEVR